MANPIRRVLSKRGEPVLEVTWPRTELLELLGVTHPIVQAPMSGYGGPALVAAVSNGADRHDGSRSAGGGRGSSP
jgi:nitronate monooxygenase